MIWCASIIFLALTLVVVFPSLWKRCSSWVYVLPVALIGATSLVALGKSLPLMSWMIAILAIFSFPVFLGLHQREQSHIRVTRDSHVWMMWGALTVSMGVLLFAERSSSFFLTIGSASGAWVEHGYLVDGPLYVMIIVAIVLAVGLFIPALRDEPSSGEKHDD